MFHFGLDKKPQLSQALTEAALGIACQASSSETLGLPLTYVSKRSQSFEALKDTLSARRMMILGVVVADASAQSADVLQPSSWYVVPVHVAMTGCKPDWSSLSSYRVT